VLVSDGRRTAKLNSQKQKSAQDNDQGTDGDGGPQKRGSKRNNTATAADSAQLKMKMI